jgi:UDP-N-acetylglucosamine diphosphorylase/glucosamine-1-phosphate N-acetyltransferase
VTRLFLLEPEPSPAWAPFAGARPIAELRAGAHRIRERWAAALGVPASDARVVDPSLTDFHETDEARVVAPEAVVGPALVVRSDVVPCGAVSADGGARLLAARLLPGRLVAGEEIVGWLLGDGERWRGGESGGSAISCDALPLRGAYDLIGALERLLGPDCLAAAGADPLPAGTIVLGDRALVRLQGAAVEPGVVFDTRAGAIVVAEGAEVRHGSRLEGPCWIGRGTRVLGGFIRGSAFGPRCSVRGEISGSVFLGYANKSHDGFVGHSAVGHWVNLGAGTTTSNLKNTYGPVRLDVGGRAIETGRTLLGALVGDHVKTAIGTMLSTGTVIGTGANVFGDAPPKWVPPFAWGSRGAERLDEAGFLRTAERVLPRRDVAVTPALRRSLSAIYRRSTVA